MDQSPVTRGRRAEISDRAGRVVGEALWLLLIGVIAAVNVIGSSWGCNDGCGSGPDLSWNERQDAWQWDAIGLGGWASFVAALLTVVAFRVTRLRTWGPRLAVLTMVLALVPWLLGVAFA